MDGERVGITLWDSAGLEKNIVDLQLREMAAFVESKFEETFMEEQKVMRSPGVKDTHIHCVFLILDPVRLAASAQSVASPRGAPPKAGGLDERLDLQVLRALWGKTTVIPIVSKADTLTTAHMAHLKRAVWHSMKSAKLDPLEALELEEDSSASDSDSPVSASDASTQYTDAIDQVPAGDDHRTHKPKKSHARSASLALSTAAQADDSETPYLPMSILSPDPFDLPPHPAPPGRRFPWGLADPLNPDHCDFTRLRDSIFSEWRPELRDLSRAKWYENWRTARLKVAPGPTGAPRPPAPASRQRVRGGVHPAGLGAARGPR